MARYAYATNDNSVVKDTTNGAFIPVSGGGFQGDAYRSWIAAGNTPDAYVPPVAPTQTPTQVTPMTYTVSTVPPASSNNGVIVIITDLPEGQRNCWSDGTNWRRISDDTIVV